MLLLTKFSKFAFMITRGIIIGIFKTPAHCGCCAERTIRLQTMNSVKKKKKTSVTMQIFKVTTRVQYDTVVCLLCWFYFLCSVAFIDLQ